jgi:hypothetical protein
VFSASLGVLFRLLGRTFGRCSASLGVLLGAFWREVSGRVIAGVEPPREPLVLELSPGGPSAI